MHRLGISALHPGAATLRAPVAFLHTLHRHCPALDQLTQVAVFGIVDAEVLCGETAEGMQSLLKVAQVEAGVLRARKFAQSFQTELPRYCRQIMEISWFSAIEDCQYLVGGKLLDGQVGPYGLFCTPRAR